MARMKRNGGDEPFLRNSEGLMEGGEQQRQTKRLQERRAGRDPLDFVLPLTTTVRLRNAPDFLYANTVVIKHGQHIL